MAHPEDIPDGASPGEAGHVTDHNKISTALTNVDNRLHAVEIAPPSGLTTEQVQDMLGTFLVAGTNVTISYNDVANTLTISAAGGGGGGASTADAISVTSVGFDGNLAPADDTVQKVAQKLDDLNISAIASSVASAILLIHADPGTAGHVAGSITVDSAGFNGNLATSDNTVQKVAQKVDDLVLGAGSMTKEQIQNELETGGAAFIGSGGISVTYDDVNNRWNIKNTPTYRGTERAGVDGVVGTTPRVGAHKVYNDSGVTRLITAVRASVGTADAGTALIVDVNLTGATIFPGAKPTIATSGTTNKVGSLAVAWPDGTALTVDVNQAGAAHANLDVNIEWVV